MPSVRRPRCLRRSPKILALVALLAGCATPPAPDIEGEVLRVIRENPQLILDSLTQYQTAQIEAERKAAETAQRAALANLDVDKLAEGAPRTGAAHGRVFLFAFSDFQCPFCQRSLPVLREFMNRHGSEVTLVFKNLPLADIHPHAASAARAAWAAHRQGQFWAYHDALFARQRELGDSLYHELAVSLKLDMKRFDGDYRSAAAQAAVQADQASAQALGIDATPHFLLGHTPLAGALPLEAFEKAFAEEISRPIVEKQQ